MWLYSKSSKGFFLPEVHGEEIPSDAVEISDELHAQLMHDQAGGQVIVGGEDGYPIAVDTGSLPGIKVLACTPAQGLVALFALKGVTEDNVLAAIGQIADPVQQYTVKIGYQRATAWERNSPTMQTMAQLLQLSEQDLDALFAYAVTVQI